MKYIAVLDTDDFEDFEFFEDGCGKYIHGIDAGSVNGEWIALYFTEYKQEPILDKIRSEINSPNRGTCDYFVIDRIEEIINEYTAEKDNQDTVPFDFELYQAGLMDAPKGMIEVLNKIKEEIKDNTYFINETTEKEVIDFETVERIINKYKVDYKEEEPMDESRMIDRETRYADEIGIKAYEQGKRDMAKELKTEVEKIFNDRPRGYNHNQRTELYVKVLQLLEKAEGKKE